jgi:hypothetical protein
MGYPCTLAAALTWPSLDGSERLAVAAALRDLATRLYQARTADYYAAHNVCGNTATEEAAADAAFLTAMSQFDRDNPDSDAWRIRAQDLFQWAFDNLNPVPGCPTPPNDVNQHYYNYQYTSSNHNMYPHPNYALSVLHDSARAVMPWAAQGITLTADVSGINDITALSVGSGSGNHHLYGGDFSAYENVYNSNLLFVADNSGGPAPVISDTSDFTFRGRTYNAFDFNDYRDFANQTYLGVAGVSDWGFGADFQNVIFGFTTWVSQTVSGTADNFGLNYERLLNHQAFDVGYGYLPTQPNTGCGPEPEYAAGAWTWGYLGASCGGTQADGDTPRPLVVFFGGAYPLTRSGQINTHLFLNSFGAFNHLVAYLYMKSPYWPPDAEGDSTLPNFAWKPPVYLPLISKP